MVGCNKNPATCCGIDCAHVGRGQPDRINGTTKAGTKCVPTVASVGGFPHVIGTIQNSVPVTRIDREGRVEELIEDICNASDLAEPGRASIVRPPKEH